MTRRRWLADEIDGDKAALTAGNAAHLSRVLRARVGQQFEIGAGDRVRLGTITSVSEERVEFALGDELAVRALPILTLSLAVIKFDRFEWAIEKCTELGVSRIVPVICRRTEPHLASAAQKRVERWQKIAHEATQQSRRLSPPEIALPTKLKEAVLREEPLRVVLNETETQLSLVRLLETERASAGIAIAVGPEGGWTEDEVRLFESHGWRSVLLGSTILRAETAAITGVALAMTLSE